MGEMISVSNLQIMIAKEASFPTAENLGEKDVVPAGDGKLIAQDNEKFSIKQSLEQNREMTGDRLRRSKVPGKKDPGGNLVHKATLDTLPLMWEMCLGSRTGSGTAHTIVNAGKRKIPVEPAGPEVAAYPSWVIYRKEAYPGATRYRAYRGARASTWSVKITATGFYVFTMEILCARASGFLTSPYDAAPTDWRNGTKIHHAMLGSGSMKIDDADFGDFLDLEISGNNNLEKDDYPITYQGDRGGTTPDDLEVKIKGTLRNVSQARAELIANNADITPADHKWAALWTVPGGLGYDHSIVIDAIQFDPEHATADARGSWKLPFTGEAHMSEGTGKQIVVGVNNANNGAAYA